MITESKNKMIHGFFAKDEKGVYCKMFYSKMKFQMILEATENVLMHFSCDETSENAIANSYIIAERIFNASLYDSKIA